MGSEAIGGVDLHAVSARTWWRRGPRIQPNREARKRGSPLFPGAQLRLTAPGLAARDVAPHLAVEAHAPPLALPPIGPRRGGIGNLGIGQAREGGARGGPPAPAHRPSRPGHPSAPRRRARGSRRRSAPTGAARRRGRWRRPDPRLRRSHRQSQQCAARGGAARERRLGSSRARRGRHGIRVFVGERPDSRLDRRLELGIALAAPQIATIEGGHQIVDPRRRRRQRFQDGARPRHPILPLHAREEARRHRPLDRVEGEP